MNILKKGSLTYDPHEIVETLIDKNLSERRACGALQINRTTQRYRQREDSVNETIREEILQLAKRHRRYGTPRMTWLLQKARLSSKSQASGTALRPGKAAITTKTGEKEIHTYWLVSTV